MSGKYLLDTNALIYAINRKLKLPDSIIAATAIDGGYVLVTDDEKLRNRHVGKSLKLDELLGEY